MAWLLVHGLLAASRLGASGLSAQASWLVLRLTGLRPLPSDTSRHALRHALLARLAHAGLMPVPPFSLCMVKGL